MTPRSHTSTLTLAAALVLPVHSLAQSGDPPTDRLTQAPIRLSLQPQPVDVPNPSQPASPSEISLGAPHLRYGDAGSEWLTFGLTGANDFDSSRDFNVHVAYSRFLVDEVEISAELAAWYFDQVGSNAIGINPSVVFRWHLFRGENWTFYHDAGIGVLFASDPVPDGGTEFDFTPRLGVGVTYGIDDDTRLQVGLRWHHVSNARINGDADNPARDAPALYFGLIRRW